MKNTKLVVGHLRNNKLTGASRNCSIFLETKILKLNMKSERVIDIMEDLS